VTPRTWTKRAAKQGFRGKAALDGLRVIGKVVQLRESAVVVISGALPETTA
jgi:hypothetical protein